MEIRNGFTLCALACAATVGLGMTGSGRSALALPTLVLSDTISATGVGAAGTPQNGRSWSSQITESPNGEVTENAVSNGIDQVYLPATAGTVNPLTIYLTEPKTTTVSDMIDLSVIPTPIRNTEDSLIFKLTSDTNANLPATVPNGAVSLDETGANQDITKLIFPNFYDANGNAINGGAPYTVVVMSDGEVPEPASLAILGIGATLLMSRKRRTA